MSINEPFPSEAKGLNLQFAVSSMPDLATAESYTDQPAALWDCIEKLKEEYADYIDHAVPFAATGIMVLNHYSKHSIEEEYDTFHGYIVNFDVHELLAKYRIIVNLRNTETTETRTMVLSTEEGYESSLIPDDISVDSNIDSSKISEKARSKSEPAEFLYGVFIEYGLAGKIDRVALEELTLVEEYLQQKFCISNGSPVVLSGFGAIRFNPNSIIVPNKRPTDGESGYYGNFLGVILYETTGLHGRAELQLSVVVELYDDSIVVQPCHNLHSFDLAEHADQ